MAFMSLQRAFSPRLSPNTFLFTRTLLNKRADAQPPMRPAGAQVKTIETAEDFLKGIGRSMDTKLSTTWEDLWKKDGRALREAGLAVRDRKYLLWCLEKYRLGFPLNEFVHEPPPKKTIRGWGPKVQNGKRIRSRRIKDKTRK